MQITYKFDPEDSQFSHPTIVRRSVCVGILFKWKTETFKAFKVRPSKFAWHTLLYCNLDLFKSPWYISRTTDTRRLNLKFFAAQIQIPLPNKYLGVGYKGLVFYRNNGWIMENMDKELTVPKWVLIVWPKITQMLQKMSAQAQKFEIFEALSGCP